ncbi:hypothetical protein J6590_014102 [Homalodisca vitripennis]|nr:hypothetical protein J6590_014102 [Homalodisca vitripennis]
MKKIALYIPTNPLQVFLLRVAGVATKEDLSRNAASLGYKIDMDLQPGSPRPRNGDVGMAVKKSSFQNKTTASASPVKNRLSLTVPVEERLKWKTNGLREEDCQCNQVEYHYEINGS